MKDVRFIWGSPQEDACMMLKGLVTSAPVLALPDSNLPYRLEADASGVATGAVLSLVLLQLAQLQAGSPSCSFSWLNLRNLQSRSRS